MKNILEDIVKREELREWLEGNHHREKECWVIVSIKANNNVLRYIDAIEEAICYGWIDSTKKKIGSSVYQRLSPRSTNSSWTELNKARAKRLILLGKMHTSGIQSLPKDINDNFVIDSDIFTAIEADKDVYFNFLNLPDLYVRIKLDNIQKIKENKLLYEKRLEKFLVHTRKNKLYGIWHDEGRLLEVPQ